MRNIILILLFSVPSLCFADMGTCYCVEAEIENLKGDVQKAYFTIGGYDFYIENQNGEYVYSTTEGWVKLPFINGDYLSYELKYQSEFSNHILTLVGSSLKYYTDILTIKYQIRNNNSQQVKMIGEGTIISTDNIKSIEIKKLISCEVGTSILSDIELIDKEWTKSVTKVEHFDGSSEMCFYTVLHFNRSSNSDEELSNEIKQVLGILNDYFLNPNKYSQENKAAIFHEFRKKINLLKKRRILVLKSCSC